MTSDPQSHFFEQIDAELLCLHELMSTFENTDVGGLLELKRRAQKVAQLAEAAGFIPVSHLAGRLVEALRDGVSPQATSVVAKLSMWHLLIELKKGVNDLKLWAAPTASEGAKMKPP